MRRRCSAASSARRRWCPCRGSGTPADVRASMALPGVAPTFDQPTLISEYLRGVGFANGQRVATQLQWNAVNRRWARRGTVPFNGDYIDIATLPYLPPDPVDRLDGVDAQQPGGGADGARPGAAGAAAAARLDRQPRHAHGGGRRHPAGARSRQPGIAPAGTGALRRPDRAQPAARQHRRSDPGPPRVHDHRRRLQDRHDEPERLYGAGHDWRGRRHAGQQQGAGQPAALVRRVRAQRHAGRQDVHGWWPRSRPAASPPSISSTPRGRRPTSSSRRARACRARCS